MTLEEFEKASEKQLRERANECFNKADTAGGLDKPHLYREAEFYIGEIERREQGRANTVSFWMELLVIVLILGEGIVAFVEGNKQADVLTKLQSSFASTAATLNSLQTTIETMNSGIQRQIGQTSDVSVEISYSPADKHLSIMNTGRADLEILGYQFDGRRGPYFKPAARIAHGESFSDMPFDPAIHMVPKSADIEPFYLPFRVFFRKASGEDFTAETMLSFVWVNEAVRLSYGATTVSRLGWSRPER